MHQHTAHAFKFSISLCRKHRSHYQLSLQSTVLISSPVSEHFFTQKQPTETLNTEQTPQEEGGKGRQTDICRWLHDITSLFYHAIPWNETSGKAPAFSPAVEEPSGE